MWLAGWPWPVGNEMANLSAGINNQLNSGANVAGVCETQLEMKGEVTEAKMKAAKKYSMSAYCQLMSICLMSIEIS